MNDVFKLRGGANNGSRLERWNGIRRPRTCGWKDL